MNLNNMNIRAKIWKPHSSPSVFKYKQEKNNKNKYENRNSFLAHSKSANSLKIK